MISKTFIILGCSLLGFGLLWHFTDGKIPLGKLPGDIRIETATVKFYFPLTTSILLSGLLSLLFYFFRK